MPMTVRTSTTLNAYEHIAKYCLTKFKGVPKHTFYLHLKETEFRFNHRRGNLYKAIIK